MKKAKTKRKPKVNKRYAKFGAIKKPAGKPLEIYQAKPEPKPELEVSATQWLWQDKSIRRLLIIAGVLLCAIIVAIALSAGGSDTVVNDAKAVRQAADDVRAAAVTPSNYNYTEQDAKAIVVDGMGAAGSWVVEWLDLIVLLMVMAFILNVFIRLGRMFR